jgi:succinoglycan biosynthesis protein ExoO
VTELGRGAFDFSVIIPAYNVSGIIERAVRSAAEQTLPPLEILVIDDCSTDNTVEVMKALAKEISSIRILSTPVNGGPSTGRNVGLRAAKGNWVAVLDSDDAWKPGRLKRLSEVAAETSADFVADNLVMWDAVRDAQFNKSYYTLSGRQKQVGTIDLFDADDNFNFTKESFSLMKPVYRRDFIVDKGLSYNETTKVGEDFTFYAESLFNGAKFILIDEPYYIYSMPSGPSGRSPHSRTEYNIKPLTHVSSMLMEKYGSKIDANLKKSMAVYNETMNLLYQSDVARGYRRSGNYARYFGYLAARPRLVHRLLARAAKKANF